MNRGAIEECPEPERQGLTFTEGGSNTVAVAHTSKELTTGCYLRQRSLKMPTNEQILTAGLNFSHFQSLNLLTPFKNQRSRYGYWVSLGAQVCEGRCVLNDKLEINSLTRIFFQGISNQLSVCRLKMENFMHIAFKLINWEQSLSFGNKQTNTQMHLSNKWANLVYSQGLLHAIESCKWTISRRHVMLLWLDLSLKKKCIKAPVLGTLCMIQL